MNKSNPRIDPDAVILFADLQAGIVERTQATRPKTLLNFRGRYGNRLPGRWGRRCG